MQAVPPDDGAQQPPAAPTTLWHHHDFMALWSGQTVSEVGSAVTVLALPLVALLLLHATTFQVGVLVACTNAAFLFIALPAGAWVDRLPKKAVLVVGDAGRFVLLASIPLAQAFGALTLAQLYTVALLTGVLTVFFDVAYQSYLPALVEPSQLVDANGKIGASQAFGQVAGPSFGGALVGAIGAAYAIVVDAASFLISTFATLLIHKPDPRLDVASRRRLRTEIREGLVFVLHHPILRKIMGCTATNNFFSSAFLAIEAVFLVRVLHASPAVIGAVFTLASAGGLVGGVLASRISARVGTARIIWLSQVVAGPFGALAVFAFRGWGVLMIAAWGFVFSFSGVVYNVAQVTYRQLICPPALLGRMNASVRFIVWGTMPLGALAGGVLGTVIGIRPTVVVCAIGMWAAALWVVFSPLFGMRDVPMTPADDPWVRDDPRFAVEENLAAS